MRDFHICISVPLKEYEHLKHDVTYEIFPLSILTTDKLTSKLLTEEDKSNLTEYDVSFQ